MPNYFDVDNMYCGAVKRGDIFLYEKNKGHELAALVLQDNVLNDGLPTVVCAHIEPHKKGDEIFVNEVMLPKNENGLGKDGLCLLHKIMTVDRRLIVAKKGELNEARMKEVFHALDINLGRFRDFKK